MKNKITAILFIVVFLLIVAVLFTFFSSMDKKPEETPSVPSAEPSDVIIDYSPEPSQPVETAAPSEPANTPVPTPPPTPTPTPTPSAEPEPSAPISYGTDLGSGSFKSDTGAKLDIHADWSAKTISSTQVEVTVKVMLDSYSLHLQGVANSVNINLGGQYVSLDAPKVEYDGSEKLTTELASKTFTVDLAEGQSDNLSLAVEWHFGGSYGNMDLPVLECGGAVSLSR